MNKNERKNETYPIEGSNFIMYNNIPSTGAYEQEVTPLDNLKSDTQNNKDEFSKPDKKFDEYEL